MVLQGHRVCRHESLQRRPATKADSSISWVTCITSYKDFRASVSCWLEHNHQNGPSLRTNSGVSSTFASPQTPSVPKIFTHFIYHPFLYFLWSCLDESDFVSELVEDRLLFEELIDELLELDVAVFVVVLMDLCQMA